MANIRLLLFNLTIIKGRAKRMVYLYFVFVNLSEKKTFHITLFVNSISSDKFTFLVTTVSIKIDSII